jgi:glutaredoxin 3
LKNITVYSKNYCPYCDRAKAILNQRGIPFEEINIEDWEPSKIQELFERSGMRTVPQIFANEQLIGGYTELAALDQKDGLRNL